MKKIFKKLVTIFLMITLVYSLSIKQVSAEASQEIKEVNTKITKIYYQEDAGYYIAHTQKDKEGRFYVLYLTSIIIPVENKQMTKALNSVYLNKNIIITISCDSENEEDEILNVWVTK